MRADHRHHLGRLLCVRAAVPDPHAAVLRRAEPVHRGGPAGLAAVQHPRGVARRHEVHVPVLLLRLLRHSHGGHHRHVRVHRRHAVEQRGRRRREEEEKQQVVGGGDVQGEKGGTQNVRYIGV